MVALAGSANADTLRDALVSAYRTNPNLTAQREVVRQTDAGVAIARAAGRPQVSANIGLNRSLTRSGIIAATSGSKGPVISGGVDLSVPFFTGGRVRNGVQAARTRVEAGRSTLRAVEGDVFTQATTAYMNVIRDRAIVELNQNNVSVLETNLRATRDRFQIGDVTRTDVAQSEARLSLARSNLETVRAQLTASEETYRQVVGHDPGTLAPPPPLPPLPATSDEAVRIAIVRNPDLISITQQTRAAGYDVSVARSGRLPTLSGVASGNYVNTVAGSVGPFPRSGTETSLGVAANIPLYQGGLVAGRIRQAQAVEGQLLEQTIGTERAVVAQTGSAFAAYSAAERAIESNHVAVQANQLALTGARAENSVGTRTILDVLNAEQELLNSQVAEVSARRDAYVAGFQLLNAMGMAQVDELGLDGGPLYDPTGNYRRVANGRNDWANDKRHVPVATRTVTPQEDVPPTGVTRPR
ncbi:hypothetical protein HMF7854_05580 [Sphingomonas ginkgonis]|uniref:Uncharacterized protein n=2 Tax=Sphingomonas ginkgonis TaxID=2315330 RepID=A0A429VDS5_9SPHN|nr:hypothetical protein HMF7854_05580 [Sphingomonas ginkgonis]